MEESIDHPHCIKCIKWKKCTVQDVPGKSCKIINCPLDCGAVFHSCKGEEHKNLCMHEKVPCINAESGCPATMLRKYRSKHLPSCPASIIYCSEEWDRWPIHFHKTSPPPISDQIDSTLKSQLDVSLAMRDQRMLRRWCYAASKGQSLSDKKFTISPSSSLWVESESSDDEVESEPSDDEVESESSDDESDDFEQHPKRKRVKKNYKDSSHLMPQEKISRSTKFSINLSGGALIKGLEKRNRSILKPKADKEGKVNQLSEYERKLQKNREDKMEFLKSLKMNDYVNEFKESVEKLKPPRKVKIPKVIIPRERSSRLANNKIDLSERAVELRAQKQAELLGTDVDINKFQRSKHVSFIDVSYGNNDFKYYLYSVCKENNEIEEIPTKNEINFSQMHLIKENTCPQNTTMKSFSLHPIKDKVVCLSGWTSGKLSIWDMSSGTSQYILRPHMRAITHVGVHKDDFWNIVTSSNDGTLRCGNFESEIFTRVLHGNDVSYTHFDFISAQEVLVSQSNGYVSLIDFRKARWPSYNLHQCHDSFVNSVSIHPVNKHIFITGGSKGIIKYWDLRNLQKVPIFHINMQDTSARCFFSPATGKSILCENLTNKLLHVYDTTRSDKLFLKCQLRRNSDSLAIPSPRWLPNSDELFIIGNGLYPYNISIMDSTGIVDIIPQHSLVKKKFICHFHQYCNTVASVNTAGRITLFH